MPTNKTKARKGNGRDRDPYLAAACEATLLDAPKRGAKGQGCKGVSEYLRDTIRENTQFRDISMREKGVPGNA